MEQSSQTLNAAKVEQFGQKMLGVMNGAALSLMVSIGHRTGLFDTLSQMPPSTVEQIAERSGLNERYVREWLSAMFTGGIVDYVAELKVFWLPPEHAALLTRAAVPGNIAQSMQWISVLGKVEDHIVDCFRKGGGVHYCHFDRFHDVMADESTQTTVSALLDHILPLAPDVHAALQKGIDVLDIGCGAGRAMSALAAAFPNSRFTGYDFCDDAIAKARAEVRARSVTNVRFEVRDAASFNDRSAFDLITAFDAIHDQADPARVLGNIAAALRPNGTFLMQDIRSSSHLEKNVENPVATFLYTISCMHCMTVSLAQNGAGLGTCWGEELALRMLDDAGFRRVNVHALEHDILNNYFVATFK
jgi:SAM-dependent methyltransferase